MARSQVPVDSMAVTLDRYQELLRLPEAAFNGLNKPDDVHRFECSLVWNQRQRELLAIALQQAHDKRITELGYYLKPTYVTGEEHYLENDVVMLDKYHLIDVGVHTLADVELGVTLDHGVQTAPNDPVTLSIVLPSGLSGGEVHVFYPDDDVRIFPSKVTVASGTIKMSIPRSRLVKPELNDDREDHLSYYNNDNFLETVDIKYSYTHPANGVLFAWDSANCPPGCTSTTQQGCAMIKGERARRISKINVRPGSYSGATFTSGHFSRCGIPATVRVSYLSGKQANMNDEMMTVRLAHTLMHDSPCSCSVVDAMWRDDRSSEDKSVTPYGYSKGATAVWLNDMRARIGAGGTL